MSLETALKPIPENYFLALFDDLEPIMIETVESEDEFITSEKLKTCCAELRSCFERDSARMNDVSDLLFGEDITAYGERAAAVFSRWEEEGGGPTLTAMLASAIEAFKLDKNLPAVKALFLSAILAEVPNNLQYHGNEHYRKVLFHAIRLAMTHNILFVESERFLDSEQIILLLISACIHDLGHKGGDNLCDGVYTPGAMEQYAFDLARPYFLAAGFSEEEAGQVETLVFCTDITFFAGENSPCLYLKKIYKHFFWEDDTEDISLMMMGKLRRYDENPALVQIAMMLHEADVGTSAGLNYEQTIKETIDIMEERDLKIAGPKVVLAFLREQLGETMFTEAGKQLFGAVMAQVISTAEEDVMSGRETFYD